ncbi:uncharacterized protein LOC132944258 [Metopolophium dirhodum]|uniref:uncharacterized protein LOC132944258 n=1 Tax=Metopolophium dirhodum TaxID=44670 RepID=UPI00298FD7FB|nr:uncharacterized protein LOC132944258 [Metopolophium dirhodum]
MHKQEIVLSEPLMSLDPATDLDEPNAKMDLNEGNLSNKISKYNEELTKEMHKQEIVLSEPLMSLDPGKWVFPLSGSQRHDLVQNGPQQMLDTCDENYPLDNNKRHFSNFHYTRKLSNGETQHRRWLVYSQSQDKIYCFPCTVFSNLQTQMIREGCCDWKHLSTILQRHEKSKEHMVCMIKWVEFDKRIKLGKTIDQENEKRIRESQKHWYNLFEKLINVINFLASHNLSFRGHRESMKLDDSNNSGNFIDLLKLLSKYDHSLQNHFQLINEKQLAQHYLSHDIQNELIKLMSKKVIEEIISKVKLVKYYAFMLDCTRDISRVEQMSIILRFCNTSTGDIEEHFIGFIAVDSTTGEHLTNIILHELKSNGLDIQDCRGQGFDNGANMVGINKGVKTRILNINPKAFFAPCGCHSWNLILVDAAKSSITATTFFGFIQKIYLLFSKSSKRWDLIKDKLKLTLKSLSETRWESRIAAVKAILFQFDDIIDCINILKMQIVDAETLCDCEAILKEMLTFEFIVAIHVWYEILLRVNNISKIWQSVQVNLKMAVDSLNNFCNWIQEYRDIGFNKSIIESRQFIEKSSYEIELNFKNKRIAKKKKMFSYEHTDEPIENEKIARASKPFYDGEFIKDCIISAVEVLCPEKKQALSLSGNTTTQRIEGIASNVKQQLYEKNFEIAMHQAVFEIFPETEGFGCRFHLGQAWYRKIQNLGYAPQFNSANDDVGKCLVHIFGLPFLNPEEVAECFTEYFMADKPENAAITEFFDYLVDSYISNESIFPPKMWARQCSLESIR